MEEFFCRNAHIWKRTGIHCAGNPSSRRPQEIRILATMFLSTARITLRKGLINNRTVVVAVRGYHENIVEHYENPRNVGSLDKNDATVGTVGFGE